MLIIPCLYFHPSVPRGDLHNFQPDVFAILHQVRVLLQHLSDYFCMIGQVSCIGNSSSNSSIIYISR
jgi:hypothetical protein